MLLPRAGTTRPGGGGECSQIGARVGLTLLRSLAHAHTPLRRRRSDRRQPLGVGFQPPLSTAALYVSADGARKGETARSKPLAAPRHRHDSSSSSVPRSRWIPVSRPQLGT